MGIIEKVPTHVGIIMDGNGRWAKLRGLPRIEGHRRGAERALNIIRKAPDLGVKVLTLYTFSMENWRRPTNEITLLMRILESYMKRYLDELVKENVKFRAIGEVWRLPKNIQALIRNTEKQTADNTRLTLVTALSYGGRNEIVRAVQRAISLGRLPEDISEESFSELLDTAGLPPVDLIVRTSGEIRISNFLLWQAAYAELYFTDTLWPDFDDEEFKRAINEFRSRERRFGAVPVREA